MNVNAEIKNDLVMEEFMIPSLDPGISLYVRNKYLKGDKTFPGEKILLTVNGSTYAMAMTFIL
jgi:hypothetical protein